MEQQSIATGGRARRASQYGLEWGLMDFLEAAGSRNVHCSGEVGTQPNNSNGLFRFFGALETLEFFAGLEADGFARRNVDFFPGPGIAANAGLARLDAEDAKAAELDALAAAEGLLEGFEDGFDGLLGFGAADVRRGDDGIYDIQLNHTSLRRFRWADARGCRVGCQGREG